MTLNKFVIIKYLTTCLDFWWFYWKNGIFSSKY